MRFILISIMTVLTISVYGYKPEDVPCDTIKLLDGGTVLGRIFYEDRTIVRYYNCNESIRTKHEIPMFEVKEIAYGSDQHNQPAVENKSHLNEKGIYWVVIGGILLVAALVVALVLL